MLEWVAISFSRGSSQSRDQTLISCIGRRILYSFFTGKPTVHIHLYIKTEIERDYKTVLTFEESG